MLEGLRRLWLGLAIIAAASVLLVMTDASRRPRAAGPAHRVTLLCFSSIQPVEEAAASFRARLDELLGPGAVELRKLNAEGDIATLRQMALYWGVTPLAGMVSADVQALLAHVSAMEEAPPEQALFRD